MEFLLGLYAGMVWYELVFVGIFLFGAGFSIKEENGIVFTLLTAFGIIYLQPTMEQIENYWMYIPMYLLVGFGWSLFKHSIVVSQCVQYVTKKWESIHKYDNDIEEKNSRIMNEIKEEIEDNSNIQTRSYWVVLFPFSMIGFLLGDLLTDIINRLGFIYDRISTYIINKNMKG